MLVQAQVCAGNLIDITLAWAVVTLWSLWSAFAAGVSSVRKWTLTMKNLCQQIWFSSVNLLCLIICTFLPMWVCRNIHCSCCRRSCNWKVGWGLWHVPRLCWLLNILFWVLNCILVNVYSFQINWWGHSRSDPKSKWLTDTLAVDQSVARSCMSKFPRPTFQITQSIQVEWI